MAEDTGLMGNNLFWQYLSNIGAAISKGEPAAPAMNAITQQNIGAQSKVKAQNAYLKQLAEALRGSAPQKSGTSTGSSASIKMGPTGLTANVPIDRVLDDSDTAGLLGQLLGDSFMGEDINKPAPLIQGQPQPQQQLPSPDMLQQTMAMLFREPTGTLNLHNQLMGQFLNPQTSPLNISNADLAGLSSADVSQAMHDVIGMESLRQRALENTLGANAQVFEMQRPGKEDRKALDYPIPVYGLGTVSTDQWDKLDTDTKAYSAYRYLQGIQNPNESLMDFKEFKRINKDDQLGYLDALSKRPDLIALKKDIARASAPSTSINVADRAEQTAKGTKVGGMKGEIERGDYLSELQQRIMKKDEIAWSSPPGYQELADKKYGGDRKKARNELRNRMLIEEATREVRAQYPEDEVERRVDGIYVNGKRKVVF